MATIAAPRARGSAERVFYFGMTAAMALTVFVGFARSFFLRPLFPDFPAPAEPFFFFHGVAFAAWFVFLVVQSALVTARRTSLHRRLGWWGAGLTVAMIGLGIHGSLVAARRPGGFVGIPLPGLQFLAMPIFDIVLFGAFVALAVLRRRDTQAHKRWMLLATVNVLDAAVARWPGVGELGPPGFFLLADLFIVALAIWDLKTRGRLHTATAWGGALIVLSQPLRLALSGTAAWLAFAGWLAGLPI
jgi:uncharacterized membrane protein YhaH (DUF805 family)